MEKLELAYEINSLLKIGESYCELNLGSEETCSLLYLLMIIIKKNEELIDMLDTLM